MSVQLVNGHVLFPHRANYGELPQWERRWQNEVVDSEFGQESRFALREVPRVMIKWKVTSADIAENSQLADRILAAKKSGLACAPYWGRGSELAAIVSGSTIEIEASLWPWAQDDYCLLIDASGNFEVGQLAGVAGSTLTLTGPVARPYHSGGFVWPLIFGQFAADGLSALTARFGEATLTIVELTSPDTVGIGTPSPGPDGIGEWIIEDTFVCQ
jgi:hypothetical protein